MLTDGQTLEGVVRIEGPTVRIIVRNGVERAEIVLAAESVQSINPRTKPEQIVDGAAVRLKDGRLLRGRAIAFKDFVRVVGAHGEVEVRREEVVSIRVADPPRSQLLVDGDLGIAIPVPKGWSVDDPTALGERLRLVDDDGQCFVSILTRILPEGDSTLAQVRAALLGDLGPRAQVTPRGEKVWIEDEIRAPGSDKVRVRRSGWVEIKDDLLVWFQTTTLATLPRERREATEALAKRARWIKPGVHKRAALLYAPKLNLLLTAPAETRLTKPAEGPSYLIRAKQGAGTLEVFHLPDERDPDAAIRDRLEVETVSKETVGSLDTYTAELEGVRALCYRAGGGSVLLIARAKAADLLSRLTRSARLLDSKAVLEDVGRDTRIARQKAEIRLHLHEQRPVQAEQIARELLAAAPEDPELLGLAVACRRAQEKSISEDLDGLYSSLGAEWTARELAEALLSEGREYGPDRYVDAANALERAAQVWSSKEIATEVQTFFVLGAKAAFKEGKKGKTWARLARARKVGINPEAVDKTEQGLRLDSADAYLKAKKPDLARREARRAYELGGEIQRIERIYATAERVQTQLKRAAKKKNRGSGGFQFGIPPSRTTGSRRGRVRATAFTRPQRGNRRVRAVFRTRSRRLRGRRARSGRQRRVRRYFPGSGRSRRARVRSRGKVLFR